MRFGIGMVGYGGIGRVHSLAYRSLRFYYDPCPFDVDLVGVCTATKESGEKAVSQAGFEFATTEYQELLDRKDIDVIDCTAPNFLHPEIVIKALEAGKHVYCEKPLASTLADARRMLEAWEKSDRKFQMVFNYRFVPAVMRAKQLIDEGFLGRIYHFRFTYLHSGYQDPNRPLSWRLTKSTSGGGALVDLGSHCVDLLIHLVGEVEAVNGSFKTYLRRRPVAAGGSSMGEVDVDDAAWVQIRTKDGAQGTVEVSRFATGTNDDFRFEIYGENGSLEFNLMDPNFLRAYDARMPDNPIGGKRGFTMIETVQRYPKPAVLPPGRAVVGWDRLHAACQFHFLSTIVKDLEPNPSCTAGYKVQEVLEAAYLSADVGREVVIAELDSTRKPNS